MMDAKGVFFNARNAPEGSDGPIVLDIIGDADQNSNFVRSFDSFFTLLQGQRASLGLVDRLEVANKGVPERKLLHDPKSGTWPVRDQGKFRGTCVAFATAAAYELAMNLKKDVQIDFSEEFLYAMARSESYIGLGPGDPPFYDRTGATFLLQLARVLQGNGVCGEDLMPYKYVQNDPAWTAMLKNEAIQKAEPHKLPEGDTMVSMKYVPPRISDNISDGAFNLGSLSDLIQNYLCQDQPVAITIPVFASEDRSLWTAGNAWRTGVIPDPTPDMQRSRGGDVGHAVCIIGMVPDAQNSTKGWFIFRNSWGTRFGSRRPQTPELDEVLAPGYGAISFDHVNKYCWGILVMQLQNEVD